MMYKDWCLHLPCSLRNGNPPFDENDQPSPIDPYGVPQNGACEMDIQIAGEQHGLDWCIIRPHNVYGEKQNIWDRYRNVLGIWMYQHIKGKPMTIFGDGEQTRAFSYIGDCLEPLYKSAFTKESSKQIINLGSGVFYSIKHANDVLRKVISVSKSIYLEKRHEVKDAHPTLKKSVELLQYKDKNRFENRSSYMWNWGSSNSTK